MVCRISCENMRRTDGNPVRQLSAPHHSISYMYHIALQNLHLGKMVPANLHLAKFICIIPLRFVIYERFLHDGRLRVGVFVWSYNRSNNCTCLLMRSPTLRLRPSASSAAIRTHSLGCCIHSHSPKRRLGGLISRSYFRECTPLAPFLSVHEARHHPSLCFDCPVTTDFFLILPCRLLVLLLHQVVEQHEVATRAARVVRE